TGRRLILELGVLLALESQNFVLPLTNDSPLDLDRLPSRIRLYLVPRRPGELFPGRFGQVICDFLQVRHGFEAEVESHPVAVPCVELLTLAEGRVATKHDLAKAPSTTHSNGFVGLRSSAFLTGTIPGAIHDAKNLTGFGERNEQR